MAKTFKRALSVFLALIMCGSTLSVGVSAAETPENPTPAVTVQLVPGKDETSSSAKVDLENGTVTRDVKATTSDIIVTTKQTAGELTAVQSALKFDRNSTADQKAQKVARELYTDNGHFHDPSTFTVTDAPEGYPFKYVGHGDYSGHYVSHIKVIYERDAAGNAIKDANGNYVIKELQHAGTGTPLYHGGKLATNPDGPFHYATGTRPQQFLLMDEFGKTFYGYCIDLATGAEGNTWYALANLEDNDYYATQESEDHVRGIVFNGYWGTESGTGSLASLKEALKAAVAAGSVEDEYNIKMVNRKKFTTGYELAEGEYHYGSYVYWDISPVDVTLTADIIDQMTEGEALDAMQAAIWSYANGSQATLNGVDGVIVGDLSASSSTMSDSLNGKNDPEGAARTRALYAWLMSQKVSADDAKTVIVNDKTFVEDMSLTIGKQLTADAFEAKLSFSNSFTVDQDKDNLKIVLTYVDADGYTQNIEKSLTGEGALVAENGYYTIDGLKLSKAKPFQFTLNIVGEQYLTKNAYIFTSENGTKGSQTMVSLAEGTISVDVSKTVDVTFNVENTFTPVIPPKPPVDDYIPDIPVDKKADGLDEKDQTNVTLTVGGESETAPVDVVIALGAGIAAEANTRESMINLIKPLVEKGVPVKLGLVAVEHYKDVAMGLTELTAENYVEIIDSGLATIKSLPAGPTNLHSNIEAAKAMLDADGAVMAENKYFYVIATGRTYNYDNEYGAPTTIINKLSHNGKTYYYWGHYLWQSQRGQHTSLYRVPTSYNNNFAAYWADVEKWVAADGDTYAYTFPITDYNDPQWFNNYYAVNGTDLKAHGIAGSRYGWLITELNGKDVAAIGSGTNPQNALNYERAQYEAYYAYKAMVDAGYKCQALCSESPSYQNYSPYMSVQGVTPGIQLGHSFMDHMAKLSGQKAATVLFQMTDNNGNYKVAENFFSAIEAVAGAATVPAGSYVEDFIGKNENGNFEFKPEAKYLTLVNNGVTYTAAKVETKEGADASFTFTAPEATEPTFTLDYYYGDGKTTEKFVWTFGEDVTGTITLTYKLQLIGKQEAEGNYTVNTNNSATLYPTGGEEKEFPIPTVDYEVKKEEIDPAPPMEMGEKTSKEIGENRFEVSIDVPGMDGYTIHDEVILMVDGSYSGDKEWPAMKTAINAIGETVLNGSGSTKLTLMAFGMGDNFVLKQIKDATELANALGNLPGNLLRGVSSTNCEAGFTGVDEYIRSRKNDLHDAIVVYITDGGINTDETPRDFYHWRKYAPNANNVIGWAIDGADTALLQAALLNVKGVEVADKAAAYAALDTCSTDEVNAVTDYIWATVFEYSGMTPGKEYPISEGERAFLKYDEDHGSVTLNSFLLAMKNSSFDKYPNVWNRTYNAVFDLAENALVKDLYLVRYQNDGRATWMPDAAAKSDSDKIHYVKSDSITTLFDALQGTLGELSITPFNDVVVTDYMSKWVNLDASTLKIVDNTTGEAIWTAADGWLISENRPTAQEVPVVVELVDPADYAAGGEDVIGNTNGDIYKLTWYVKDGAMLRADTYALKYEVDVDTAEEGFVDNTNYPANGTTNLTYTDENGNKHTNEIKVPDVHGVKPVPEIPEIPTVSFKNGDASNISFMLLDPATGEVEFVKKYDIGNETSYEIPTEEGKISCVFIKQSTSGMFWASEELNEAEQNAVIDCLKANNPSYKGYNAFCFGEGDHELEFKKGKFVTYTFAATAVDIEDEDVPGAATPEATETPATEIPATEAPATEVPATEAPATEAPATEPEHDFHGTGKTHLLGDAEGDLETFNFKFVEENIPKAGEERYAVVGAGEQTEFWTAYLIKGGDLKVTDKNGTETGYAYVDNAKKINGIYLDGVFYPADSDAITYPGKEEGKALVANYNGLQQAMLMNGNGKKVAVYCADHVISTTTDALYDVVNIEDATHFNDATAGKIRAVAVNGYWGGTETVDQYGALAKMKAMMKASGEFTQEEIDHLSPGVALSATQFAIWELANNDDNRQVVNVQYIQKNRVAGYNGKTWNTLKVTPEEEIACVDLIFKLSHYLTQLNPISVSQMSTANTVLNYQNILKDVNIEVLKKAEGHENNADSNKDNDAYVTNVTFDMLKVSEKDSLVAKIVDADGNVYAIGRIAGEGDETRLTDNGNGTYTFSNVTLIENAETTYTVVVEGVQYLERNVYLYFAGERGTSQTLIGYDEGEFTVNVESSIKKTFNVDEPETPPTVSFKNGDASNISFMLLDPATGEVEFVKKYDIGSETSYEIPTEEGKISCIFVKQSTSGMFWFSQDINEDLQQAVIDCLKANNPSYKGHNAIAFGEGDHELEFKKGKFVTYTFAGDIADVEVKEDVKDEVIETTPVETTPVETTPAETEKKPEAPKGELTVKVEGGKVKNWTVIDGVTGIYIEANGKIPAVIWTSVKVDDAALAAFVEALGADPEAEVIYDFGSHDITYNHNKNKTKTVTFTFTNLAQEEPAPVAEVAETEASEPVVEETQASEPVVEETKPEATETEPEVEETKASEPVVEETEPEATETEPEVEETKASEPVVEETEPEATETEPEVEETKGNGKNKKNK